METIEAILTRRSVRGWTDTPVPEELLAKILEAGNASPSPLNSQPWHYIVVRSKSTLAALSTGARHASFLRTANVVIVVTADKHPAIDEWLAEFDQHFYAAAGSLFLMWLAAWDLGLGGCWVTIDEQSGRKFLGIPDSHKIIGGLALGYPRITPVHHKPDDRTPLASKVSYEKFS